MTDLASVLPGFPTQQYARLLPKLEKNLVTTTDLLTLDCVEVAKRAQLPLLDVKRLCNAVLEALQQNLGIAGADNEAQGSSTLKKSGKDIVSSWNTISTLDDDLDRALGGGIPIGYITEVTGERQNPIPPHAPSISPTPSSPRPLQLRPIHIHRIRPPHNPDSPQLLRTHPVLTSSNPKPTLDNVISIVTPDLESQDHILRFQVPVAISRHSVRLIILDSVAANYRAEFERPGGVGNGANMAQRSSELIKLGQLLRTIAREHNIAIVVANQVADRFSNTSGSVGSSPVLNRTTQSSPLARRSAGTSTSPSSSLAAPPPTPFAGTPDPMSLDHQQRWFTGWGDDPHPSPVSLQNLKTPSLGLIWTTQIAFRIALIKKPVYGPGLVADEEELVLQKWRRWMKVVFAPHVAASGPGVQGAVEFEIRGMGIAAVGTNRAVDVGEEDGILPT
ncbi:DNA repair protein rhp57 [Lachnellula hyalina]|uniref:DNA repair protein rhp57 n=1 Tax=Lachnellula hyalina TaxID=1316788 RepID=A0A8H8QU05_9HELO|nr:DNA repair protein rhp57 [Lachnellula hyalina]TVY22724.1 DNA repair protein rhp57 [Lachnellula hyalina]